MAETNRWSRRGVLLGGVAGALGMIATTNRGLAEEITLRNKDGAPFKGLKVGVATYTLTQQFKTADEAVKAVKRVGVQYCSIKEGHLPYKSTTEERKATVAKFKAAGITPLSVGNVTLKNDEAQIRAMFEYTRDVGVPVMVCAPDKAALPIYQR